MSLCRGYGGKGRSVSSRGGGCSDTSQPFDSSSPFVVILRAGMAGLLEYLEREPVKRGSVAVNQMVTWQMPDLDRPYNKILSILSIPSSVSSQRQSGMANA